MKTINEDKDYDKLFGIGIPDIFYEYVVMSGIYKQQRFYCDTEMS